MDDEKKRESGCLMIMVVVLAIAVAVLIGFMAIAYFFDEGEYDPDRNTEGQDVYEQAMLIEPTEEWHWERIQPILNSNVLSQRMKT